MKLDPKKVPEALRPLLAWAELWAFTDDGYRGDAIEEASSEELEDLVHAFDGFGEAESHWLSENAHRNRECREVDALICLMMAMHLAVVELKLRRDGRR